MATSITNTSISTDTINVDNGVLYVDNVNNRVGVGTASPTAALEVNRDSSPFIAIFGASQGSGKAVLFKDNHASPNKYNYLIGSQYNINNGFEITPSTAIGGTTFSNPAIAILENGRVGIGITNPAQLLHVQAGASGNGTIRLGGGAGLEISHDNSANTVQRIDSLYRTTSNDTNLQLRTGTLTFHTGTTSTERMRIDYNGRVTTPYQPGFRAVLQSNWTGITNTPQKITGFSIAGFGSYQVGNNFSSDRFTAPVTGQYHFSITSLFSQSQGYWSRLYFRKNGNTIAEFLRGHSYSSQWHEVAGSALIFLNTGDYIEVYADAEAGASYVYSSYTQWHGVLLG